jgi:hypothetical protein
MPAPYYQTPHADTATANQQLAASAAPQLNTWQCWKQNVMDAVPTVKNFEHKSAPAMSMVMTNSKSAV